MTALHCRRSQGATLTEYALIGALITVITIPAWQLISNGLNATLTCMIADFTGNTCSIGGGTGDNTIAIGGTTTGGTNNAAPKENTAPQEAPAKSTILPDGSVQIEVNGKKYILPELVDPNTVVTSASNGSDISLAYYQHLMELAKELEEILPEGDPLADLIRNVAEKGHTMANLEGIIESHCSEGVCSSYKDSSLDVSATEQQKPSIAGDTDGLYNYTEEVFKDIGTTKGELTDKWAILQAAITSSTSLDDAAKTALLDSLGYNVDAIVLISGIYSGQTGTEKVSSTEVNNVISWVGFDDPGAEVGEELTDLHSETVCKHQNKHQSCQANG